VSASLYTAVTNDINIAAYGVDDLGELIKGGSTAIKLSTSVIRYHNGICPNCDRFTRILHRHNAL
jgi:hypothetical protein